MSDLDNTIQDGFNIETTKDKELGIAFSSLKIALKSYFSTYQCFKGNLTVLSQGNLEQEQIDYHHHDTYCELCTETLIHFQHFFELACKKILKDEHPLLADVALTKPVVLYKLLNSQQLSEQETNSLRSIEFSEAISRLDDLIKSGQFPNSTSLQFIRDHKNTLTKINALRNRLWHRGVYVLRYPSLDKLICKYVLPLLHSFLNLPAFKGQELLWKYKPLECGVDPLSELIAVYSSEAIDLKKVAFIKEMGRAAYNNPLMKLKMTSQKVLKGFADIYDNKHIQRAIRISETEARQEYASILNCPVCGVKSLVLYTESEMEYDEEEMLSNGYTYTDRVICECCQLSLHSDFENATQYGLKNIEDFWIYKRV
ncbi:hypothetical protein NTH32_005156 [Vibrio harveyi]|nr:hypothetical protein [Vibrio harveyi]